MTVIRWMLCFAILALPSLAEAKKKEAETPIADSDIPFSPADAAWAADGGKNSVIGNAMLRTVGGDVKTCAGLPAQLVPQTPYGTERIARIYGSTIKGFIPIRYARPMSPAKAGYSQIIRETVCDSEGRFKFTNLADGAYFLNALVVWGVPTRYFTRQEGGRMMLRVEVKGGEIKEVVLTN